MSKQIFVNLAVKDLEKSKIFFTALAELANLIFKSGSIIQSENFLNPNLLINSSYSS